MLHCDLSISNFLKHDFEVWILCTLYFFSFELYSYIWKYLWSLSYFFIILNIESKAQKVPSMEGFPFMLWNRFFFFLVMDKMFGIVTFNKILKCCVCIVVKQCLFSMNVKFSHHFLLKYHINLLVFIYFFLWNLVFFFQLQISEREK